MPVEKREGVCALNALNATIKHSNYEGVVHVRIDAF